MTKTATVSLHGNGYEVDAALVGRRCELIFDPFDLTKIEVRYQGRPLGLAVPVRIGRHVHPQAKHEPAPPALGHRDRLPRADPRPARARASRPADRLPRTRRQRQRQ